jgi:hypothetical protein
MKKWIWPTLALVTFTLGYFSNDFFESQATRGIASVSEEMDNKIIGSSEEVWFGAGKELYFHAKIDSGAESSSIHASKITSYTKSGKMFVEFETMDDKNIAKKYSREVSKIDEVKNSLGAHKRYFFYETVWIGHLPYYAELNVTDRSHLSRRFLVGKNILKQGFLIDSSQEKMTSLSVPSENESLVTISK